MLDLKEAVSRRRVISVDKKRLTLSGSKIMISSLSSSLIKFYEAQPTNEKNNKNSPYFSSLLKSRSSRSLNLNSHVRIARRGEPNCADNKGRAEHNKVNEYGIPIWCCSKQRIKKYQTANKQSVKTSKLQIKCNSLRLQVEKQNKRDYVKSQQSPYLNFTFGDSNLGPR